MFVPSSPVTFSGMAKKEPTEPTQQINFRLRTATVEKMERYRDAHPLRPTLTQMVEAAMAEWLDAHPVPPRTTPKRHSSRPPK